MTPRHPCPAAATMPVERSRAPLDCARQHDVVIIGDDYDRALAETYEFPNGVDAHTRRHDARW
ncbi:hypothetical protein [Burkholderia sp. LMG 21824]|uniref:hypothetical protein n=1 Tax=Burkholderia sp. LMG 21824 TaxID=3158172 RepID=UPI003C2C5B3E